MIKNFRCGRCQTPLSVDDTADTTTQCPNCQGEYIVQIPRDKITGELMPAEIFCTKRGTI